jgi:hypothetical protein
MVLLYSRVVVMRRITYSITTRHNNSTVESSKYLVHDTAAEPHRQHLYSTVCPGPTLLLVPVRTIAVATIIM